jgi:hypothetical protein
MDLNRYTFVSYWPVDASLPSVYDALDQVAHYPSWWPEIKSAAEIGPDEYRLTIRSAVPVDLVFATRRTSRDPDRGVLEADLAGDLAGRADLVADFAFPPSRTELASMAFLFILAGYHTFPNLMANSVFTLLRHPAQLARLRADPGRSGSLSRPRPVLAGPARRRAPGPRVRHSPVPRPIGRPGRDGDRARLAAGRLPGRPAPGIRNMTYLRELL